MSDVDTSTVTKIEIKTPSMWKVLIFNDDFTTMEFVVQVLTQIFNKSEEEATALMLTVHEQGKATVGLYTKEVAQTKVALTTRAAETYGHPLLTVAEEA
jgi:ATP-dependent Clp protease adaptor protein ClpS